MAVLKIWVRSLPFEFIGPISPISVKIEREYSYISYRASYQKMLYKRLKKNGRLQDEIQWVLFSKFSIYINVRLAFVLHDRCPGALLLAAPYLALLQTPCGVDAKRRHDRGGKRKGTCVENRHYVTNPD